MWSRDFYYGSVEPQGQLDTFFLLKINTRNSRGDRLLKVKHSIWMHKTVKLTFQQEEIDFSVLTAVLTLRQTRRSAAAKTDSQSLKVTGRVWTFITLIWHNLAFVGVQLGNFNQWSAVSSWIEIGLMRRASASLQDTDTANKLLKFRTLFPSDEGNWLDRDADE